MWNFLANGICKIFVIAVVYFKILYLEKFVDFEIEIAKCILFPMAKISKKTVNQVYPLFARLSENPDIVVEQLVPLNIKIFFNISGYINTYYLQNDGREFIYSGNLNASWHISKYFVLFNIYWRFVLSKIKMFKYLNHIQITF